MPPLTLQAALSRLRQDIYFGYFRLRGRALGSTYRNFEVSDRSRTATDGIPGALRRLLLHAGSKVPYYAEQLADRRELVERDPFAALQTLPLLTKDTIRSRFDDLHSSDLASRRTHDQTSGGSTGEPVRLTQDADYQDRVNAAQLLYSTWTGRKFGEPELFVWGSERDIEQGSVGLRSSLANRLMGRRFFNAYRMEREAMKNLIEDLNRQPPKLIVAYVQSIDELASFAEREEIAIASPGAIISSAGTLHPPMRERIERVFGCRAFDRYGSREVGDIAGECACHRGLHVLPWNNWVEIVDDAGEPVPPGTDGRVVVTSLANFAMPLIRYEIGDRARMMPADEPPCECGRTGQRIERVLGRSVDVFRAVDGAAVDGGWFTQLMFFKDFVERFQVVQREPGAVVFRLVTLRDPSRAELDEIVAGARAAMGQGCKVTFEVVDEIPPSPSGKYRYTISEL